ncbi:hypothetical protein AAHZ94_32345, partial [Streptomyces sp. HSW2009]
PAARALVGPTPRPPPGPGRGGGAHGGAPTGNGPIGGRGLRGVRERAALLGGDANAGPAGDQWRVHVRLPLAPEAPRNTRPTSDDRRTTRPGSGAAALG